MTYRENCTLPESFLEQIAEQGLGVLPEPVGIVINTAMQAERGRRARRLRVSLPFLRAWAAAGNSIR